MGPSVAPALPKLNATPIPLSLIPVVRPSAALQTEARPAYLLCHPVWLVYAQSAFRAYGRGFAHALQPFNPTAALITLVFVDGHYNIIHRTKTLTKTKPAAISSYRIIRLLHAVVSPCDRQVPASVLSLATLIDLFYRLVRRICTDKSPQIN